MNRNRNVMPEETKYLVALLNEKSPLNDIRLDYAGSYVDFYFNENLIAHLDWHEDACWCLEDRRSHRDYYFNDFGKAVVFGVLLLHCTGDFDVPQDEDEE